MTSSWRLATLLAGVSIASAAGLFGMVLIDISDLSQLRTSVEHEGKNSYGTRVSDEANKEVLVHSENILSYAEDNLRSDTLLWARAGNGGLSDGVSVMSATLRILGRYGT
jgi:hypothetical protein